MKERIDYRARKLVVQRLTQRKYGQFDRLRDINWDVLLILDACRADVLDNVANWPVRSAVSPASCTPEWLELIESTDILSGAHVVSGNPQYEMVDVDLGSRTVEPYWESCWDEMLQTTLPEPILDRVDTIADDSADGVVGHLQQPHWPYIATIGDEWHLAYDELGPWNISDEEITSVQVAMQRGLIDVEQALRAYKASVRSIWETLTEYLPRWIRQGYTVVLTADHGETFGRLNELKFYEHPCRCHIAPLVTVPWIELTPLERHTMDGEGLEARLAALGYVEE